ncbi:MAG: L-rhamnose mutarotase [Bacteroidota bacterium]
MKGSRRYCFSCDLKDNADLISQYKFYHAAENHWTEIAESIKESGILEMEIYLTGNRMFMIMEVDDSFSFEKKARMDTANPKVQEWEKLMSSFQQKLPWATEDEKWTQTEMIFKLS